MIVLHILPLMPFSTTDSISLSVNNSYFTSVLFKAACHANLGAERNIAGSNWWIFKQIFLKFSKTSAKSNVSISR